MKKKLRNPYEETVSSDPPQNYERFFVPAIGKPLAKDLISRADLKKGEQILDVACGTGTIVRMALNEMDGDVTVTGLDINTGMLGVAKSLSKDLPIEWYDANAEEMPFKEESFDLVICQMGLQFMQDKVAALQEMRRVLVRGGRLILNLPGPTPQIFSIMAEALERHIGAEAAGFMYGVFSLHKRSEIRNLISGAGYCDVSVQSYIKQLSLPKPEEFLWQYMHSTPLAGSLDQTEDELLDLLEQEVVAKWQEFTSNGAMELEVRMSVATAWK